MIRSSSRHSSHTLPVSSASAISLGRRDIGGERPAAASCCRLTIEREDVITPDVEGVAELAMLDKFTALCTRDTGFERSSSFSMAFFLSARCAARRDE